MEDLRRSIADAGGLWTRAGLAKRWGFTRQHVGTLTLREDFPSPIWVDGKQEVWPANEADAWKAQYQPR
jgi:predicted DNA-binding transcriptional regulator AlpA